MTHISSFHGQATQAEGHCTRAEGQSRKVTGFRLSAKSSAGALLTLSPPGVGNPLLVLKFDFVPRTFYLLLATLVGQILTF